MGGAKSIELFAFSKSCPGVDCERPQATQTETLLKRKKNKEFKKLFLAEEFPFPGKPFPRAQSTRGRNFENAKSSIISAPRN